MLESLKESLMLVLDVSTLGINQPKTPDRTSFSNGSIFDQWLMQLHMTVVIYAVCKPCENAYLNLKKLYKVIIKWMCLQLGLAHQLAFWFLPHHFFRFSHAHTLILFGHYY